MRYFEKLTNIFSSGMEPHHLGAPKIKSDSEELSEIYSASERKKGSRAPWTSQDMISAMLLVKQGMSITKAAQSLNIPRTTLRDRVTGKLKDLLYSSKNLQLLGVPKKFPDLGCYLSKNMCCLIKIIKEIYYTMPNLQ